MTKGHPTCTAWPVALGGLAAEVDSAFQEPVDIARTAVVLHDGSPAHAEIAATHSS